MSLRSLFIRIILVSTLIIFVVKFLPSPLNNIERPVCYPISNFDDLCESKISAKEPPCVPFGNGLPGREARMVVLPENRLSFCPIPKNMLVASLAILCFAYDPIYYRKLNISVAEATWERRPCKHRGIEKSAYDLANLRKENWTNLVVLRDPVDRLISAYLDKCHRW